MQRCVVDFAKLITSKFYKSGFARLSLIFPYGTNTSSVVLGRDLGVVICAYSHRHAAIGQ